MCRVNTVTFTCECRWFDYEPSAEWADTPESRRPCHFANNLQDPCDLSERRKRRSSLPCGGATCIAVQAAQISNQIETLSSLVSGLHGHIRSIADGYYQAYWNGVRDPQLNLHIEMLKAQLGQHREAEWDLIGQLWSINPTCRIPIHLNIGPTPPQEASSAPRSSAISSIVLDAPTWPHLPRSQCQEPSPASEPSQMQTTSQDHLAQQDSATQQPVIASDRFAESLTSGPLASSPPSRTATPHWDLTPPRPLYGDPQEAATASTGANGPYYRPAALWGLFHAETDGSASVEQSGRTFKETMANMVGSMVAAGDADLQDPRLQGWI